MNFDRIIQLYVDEALEHNKFNKDCHMALLLNGRRVISHGFNQMDRQCFRGKSVFSLHAEIDCLRKCKPIKNIKKKNYDLLIIKVARNTNKLYHDSRPCKNCTNFIKGLGFRHVYCTTADESIKKIDLFNYLPYDL
jgi:deoxycytidylate deaminase